MLSIALLFWFFGGMLTGREKTYAARCNCSLLCTSALHLLVCPTWTAVGDAPVHTCRRRARLAQLFDEFGKLFRLLRVLLEPLF